MRRGREEEDKWQGRAKLLTINMGGVTPDEGRSYKEETSDAK